MVLFEWCSCINFFSVHFLVVFAATAQHSFSDSRNSSWLMFKNANKGLVGYYCCHVLLETYVKSRDQCAVAGIYSVTLRGICAFIEPAACPVSVWHICIHSPSDRVSEGIMFSGCLFVHLDRSCYRHISGMAWAISMKLRENVHKPLLMTWLDSGGERW